jgi:hypothetical protein
MARFLRWSGATLCACLVLLYCYGLFRPIGFAHGYSPAGPDAALAYLMIGLIPAVLLALLVGVAAWLWGRRGRR